MIPICAPWDIHRGEKKILLQQIFTEGKVIQEDLVEFDPD